MRPIHRAKREATKTQRRLVHLVSSDGDKLRHVKTPVALVGIQATFEGAPPLLIGVLVDPGSLDSLAEDVSFGTPLAKVRLEIPVKMRPTT